MFYKNYPVSVFEPRGRGPLVLEATALPTEPQPPPTNVLLMPPLNASYLRLYSCCCWLYKPFLSQWDKPLDAKIIITKIVLVLGR